MVDRVALKQLQEQAAKCIRPGSNVAHKTKKDVGEVMQLMQTSALVLWDGEWTAEMCAIDQLVLIQG